MKRRPRRGDAGATLPRVHVHRLPSWFPAAGIALRRHVFMRDPNCRLTRKHELVHVRQQLAYPYWFWVSYLLLLPVGWNRWRMRWEAEAYVVQVRDGASVESVARTIAGPIYGWCCRPEAAAKAVREFLERDRLRARDESILVASRTDDKVRR